MSEHTNAALSLEVMEEGEKILTVEDILGVGYRQETGRASNAARRDPVDKMTSLQRRIAQLLAADMTLRDIASWLEMSEDAVGKIARHPAVQRLRMKLAAFVVDDLRPVIEQVNERIANHADEAFEVELELMRNMRGRQHDVKAAGLSFSIAKDLLDRAGAAQPKKIEARTLSANISGEQLVSIRETLRELDQC